MSPAHLEPYGCSEIYQDQDANLADPYPYSFELQSSDVGLGIGAGPFSGLPVSQTAFDAHPWPVEVGESSYSYQTTNQSRPLWDVNAHSSSSTDAVSLWTAPLLNGVPNSNHAPIPGCQPMTDPNVNHDLAFSPMADIHDFAGSYLAPSLEYSLAGSNLIAQSTGFEASSGTTFDTSLGYNPRPAIADEVLSPNTLSTIGLDLLPENNNHLPQTQARSPDETFNSETSPRNSNEHDHVHNNASLFECIECSEKFWKIGELNLHCYNESHSLCACKCGKRFTRADVLFRHIENNRSQARKYACPYSYCKSRPGGKTFKRKDHLTQHIRGYHHHDTEKETQLSYHRSLCPHSDCLQYRGPEVFHLTLEDPRQNLPFRSFKEFSQHMRTVHDDAAYPCDVRGCLRVRGKGYIRRQDLISHRKREHPEAPKFKDLHSCRLPGCSGNGEKAAGITEHYVNEHGYNIGFARSLTCWWHLG